MQITKTVTPSGNGAHILLPKNWIGDQVTLTRKPRPDIKKEILSLLYPHLEQITGIYLYGSHARNEPTPNSDVDILIISNTKIKVPHKNYDIITISPDKIPQAIKLNPILMYSIFKEAKPIINSSLLKKLKTQKIIKSHFKEFITSTKRIIKINKETILLDSQTSKILESHSVIYSTFLRLKGIYIIKQLLKNKTYSNSKFQTWLEKNLPNTNYETVQEIYRNIRDNSKIKKQITIKETSKLNTFLESEIKNNNN